MIKNWILENAVLRKKEAGDDFYLPTQEEIDNLKIDEVVKLIFINSKGLNERMWVQIKEKSNYKSFIGILVNVPDNIDGLNYGDFIEFSNENIIDIYKN